MNKKESSEMFNFQQRIQADTHTSVKQKKIWESLHEDKDILTTHGYNMCRFRASWTNPENESESR